jgi:glycosyltransferase involved in cell wall biosynthesis
MFTVFITARRYRHETLFFAVGFDSAAPITVLTIQRPALIFDNIDNISLSHRWPYGFSSIFRALESWVAWRAQIHVVPSRARWNRADRNLRIVANTPSRKALSGAKAIAEQRRYRRGPDLTVYLNGWLQETRGIQTLIRALGTLRQRRLRVKVLVAGRPSCESANQLLAMECTENLGMLTNAEALATYYRSDIAFIYYDPSIAINRIAESQKWTDCWATNTAFITNQEVKTLDEYVRQGACLTLPYDDSAGLGSLLESLSHDRSPLERVRGNLRKMEFRFWDEEMKNVIDEWSELNATR